MWRSQSFLFAAVGLLLMAAPASAQLSSRRPPLFNVHMFEAHERDEHSSDTFTGAALEATRAKVARRYTVSGTLRTRLRWSAREGLGGDVYSLEGHTLARLTPRATLTGTHRVSYAGRMGDDWTNQAGLTSGVTMGSVLGLTQRATSRLTLGLAYRVDRAAYEHDDRATLAQGVTVGLWRASSRYTTWQIAVDRGWAATTTATARTHMSTSAAVFQWQFRPHSDEHTTFAVTLRPTVSRSNTTRSIVWAGSLRADRRLSDTRRVSVSYERAVSLLDYAESPLVAHTIAATFDTRVHRRTNVSGTVYYSTGATRVGQVSGRSTRMNVSARVAVQFTPATGGFVEFTHIGSALHTPANVGSWSFARQTIRAGVILPVGTRR